MNLHKCDMFFFCVVGQWQRLARTIQHYSSSYWEIPFISGRCWPVARQTFPILHIISKWYLHQSYSPFIDLSCSPPFYLNGLLFLELYIRRYGRLQEKDRTYQLCNNNNNYEEEFHFLLKCKKNKKTWGIQFKTCKHF